MLLLGNLLLEIRLVKYTLILRLILISWKVDSFKLNNAYKIGVPSILLF